MMAFQGEFATRFSLSATLGLTLIMELSLLLHYTDKINKKQICLMSLWS